VHHSVPVADLAGGALCGFVDSASVDGDLIGFSADGAMEECHFEVGYDGGGAHDHAAEGEEVVDGVRVEGSHVGEGAEVEWPDLNAR